MPDPTKADALVLRDVEKQYGALRPLRIRDLRIAGGSCVALAGFDRPAAETVVNLMTGAVLPDKGGIVSLGQATSAIADGDAWLAFVERFGFVSDRVVLLEGMTIAQNLALPFDLELDPIPAIVLPRVAELAGDVGLGDAILNVRVAEAGPTVRAKVCLARALALGPEVLLLEHPTAAVESEDVKGYAGLVARVWKRRGITVVALTSDETFGKALGGRLLVWQPATGEFRERRRWF